MRNLKMNVSEFEGYAVTVDIEGGFKDYTESFLHIFNNVRENKELFKVKNSYYNNEVTVYCEEKTKEELIKYLKMFGEIKSCKKVLMYQMEEPDYDLDKYDDVVVVPDFE